METVDGILLLGGDRNGLNFEIEYLDAEGNYREAFYSVRHDVASKPASFFAKLGTFELSFRNDPHLPIRHYFPLPGGITEILDVRRPCILGGEQIKSGEFQENSHAR